MSATGWRTPLGVIARLLLAVVVLLSAAMHAEAQSEPAITVNSRPITQFRIGRDQTRFGPLEFAGGIEMTSSARRFGSFSAFRFLSPGRGFLGVNDRGYWYSGTIERDAAGRPVGFADFRMDPILDGQGRPLAGKDDADAEGLDVKDGVATVSFERNHRVVQYGIAPGGIGRALRELDFVVPRHELRKNGGFETVTRAPPRGRHAGGLVVISETSRDKAGNILAAVIEGPRKGVFTIKRNHPFDITDGAFLPDGDLLLLERSFSWTSGVGMRLRRIHGEGIAPGKLADGPVLLEADMGYQIDNMEGLDVWTRADGALMVSLISDDNGSILQRNVYLEFVLREKSPSQ